MATPITNSQYDYTRLAAQFKASIQKLDPNKEIAVKVLEGRLTDLDNDGAQNDFAGTALLKVGNAFKSFIFLTRKDGSTVFLENNVQSLNLNQGLSYLSCSSKPIACPNTLERAASQIRGAVFSVMEYDTSKTGLEVVIPLGGGHYSVLNSLEVFAHP